MRLVYDSGAIELPLEEDRATLLCVEHPGVLESMLSDLWNQSNGEDGEWILSDGDKELDIAKEIECIYNPFAVDPNRSGILTKIYKELGRDAKELLYEETELLNQQIVRYLSRLLDTGPYPMESALEIDVNALLKGYGVRFATDAESFAESLVEYVKVAARILKRSVIMFLNVKEFISPEKMEEFFRGLRYEKVRVLFVESQDYPRQEWENKYVIDQDYCIIEVR